MEFIQEIPSSEKIQELIEAKQFPELKKIIIGLHPADIADLLETVPPDQAVIIFDLLNIEVGSEVLDEADGEVRLELLDKVDDEKLADLLDELPMDDAVEFLEEIPDPISDRLIELMEPKEAAEVRELLAYEEDSAGRLMNRDVAAVRRYWTVEETYEYLRSLKDAETVYHLYVLDQNEILQGVVPLRKLILAHADVVMSSLMEDVTAVPATADQEQLAELVARYDYYVVPVVDENQKLLGIVTADDVLDIIQEETTEDIQRLGGSEPLEQPYFATSTVQIVKKRIGWLLLLFVAATLTGTVLRFFEEDLQLVVALSFFVPLITGTGGNAGSQTVATIIRALTLGEVKLENIGKAWLKEIMVGILLGLAMGLVGFTRAYLWNTGYEVAWVVTLTLPMVVLWAMTVATIVPIVANHFKIDPTVISGPMITTIVDTSGLLIYFWLARAILDVI